MPELRHAITRSIGRRVRACSDLSDSVYTHIPGVQWAFPINAIITTISVRSSDPIAAKGVLKEADVA